MKVNFFIFCHCSEENLVKSESELLEIQISEEDNQGVLFDTLYICQMPCLMQLYY